MTQSYGLALLLQLQAKQVPLSVIIRAMEIWETDYPRSLAGHYGYTNGLKLRRLPTDSDPVYQVLVTHSKDHDLKFARGTVDDFHLALEGLFREERLAHSVRTVINHLEKNPETSVDTFVQGLVDIHTDYWKKMQVSRLRSALELQNADYRMLEKRITSSGLPPKDRNKLLSDLGAMQKLPDKIPYAGKTFSSFMDVYGHEIKPDSPGFISEILPDTYGGKGSQPKIALLFSGQFIKYVLVNDIPLKQLFLLRNNVIGFIQMLKETSKFEGFSNALNEGRSQVFGDLQALVNQGVIDASAGKNFDQVKIPDSVRLLLVPTPPGSSGTLPPEPVLVGNAGSVLKFDPTRYSIAGKTAVETHYIMAGLISQFVVASYKLKKTGGDFSNYLRIKKQILRELEPSVSEIKGKINVPVIENPRRIGIEMEVHYVEIHTPDKIQFARSAGIPEGAVDNSYASLMLTTDRTSDWRAAGTLLEIITGPQPLSFYRDKSSGFYDAMEALIATVNSAPENDKGDYTTKNLVDDYNSALSKVRLEKKYSQEFLHHFAVRFNPNAEKKFSLKTWNKKMGAHHRRPQINISIDLRAFGDITSVIPDLMAPLKNDFLKKVFQQCQYGANELLQKLNLEHSPLLASMFTLHLYKQVLDSSTEEFNRGKLGNTAGGPVTKLGGLPRFATADLIMSVISSLDAERLYAAINYGPDFFSLIEETINGLVEKGAEAEGAGRNWHVPTEKLRARVSSLFVNLLDYRIKHGRMLLNNVYKDCFKLPQSGIIFFLDSVEPNSRVKIVSHDSGEGGIHYFSAIEVRKPSAKLANIAVAPPDPETTALIKSVQDPDLLGTDPGVDQVFIKRAQSLLTSDTGTWHYRDWVKVSILDRLGQLDRAKREHVNRSFVSHQRAAPDAAGQDALGQLLLFAHLKAMTGGRSESSWDTLAQLQKIVSVDFNLQRVAGAYQLNNDLPLKTIDSDALLVARWQRLVKLNLPATLYRLLDSGDEDFIKAVLESAKIVSGNGMSLGRLFREMTIILEPEWRSYQSHLNNHPLTLTVGIKDITSDSHKAIAIGKLFAIALLNHPELVALGQTQRELQAVWGLSAISTGSSYGLTTELVPVDCAKPERRPVHTVFRWHQQHQSQLAVCFRVGRGFRPGSLPVVRPA